MGQEKYYDCKARLADQANQFIIYWQVTDK